MMRAPELKLFAANHNVSFPPFNCLSLLSLSFFPFLFLYVCLSVVCAASLSVCGAYLCESATILATMPLFILALHPDYH